MSVEQIVAALMLAVVFVAVGVPLLLAAVAITVSCVRARRS